MLFYGSKFKHKINFLHHPNNFFFISRHIDNSPQNIPTNTTTSSKWILPKAQEKNLKMILMNTLMSSI